MILVNVCDKKFVQKFLANNQVAFLSKPNVAHALFPDLHLIAKDLLQFICATNQAEYNRQCVAIEVLALVFTDGRFMTWEMIQTIGHEHIRFQDVRSVTSVIAFKVDEIEHVIESSVELALRGAEFEYVEGGNLYDCLMMTQGTPTEDNLKTLIRNEYVYYDTKMLGEVVKEFGLEYVMNDAYLRTILVSHIEKKVERVHEEIRSMWTIFEEDQEEALMELASIVSYQLNATLSKNSKYAFAFSVNDNHDYVQDFEHIICLFDEREVREPPILAILN